MRDLLLGTTKEQRETIKQLKARLKTLEDRAILRRNELHGVVETHRRGANVKWEYLQLSDKNIDQWGGLNSLGMAGWELVGIATFEEGGQFKTVYTQYVLKRRITPVPESVL